MNVKDLAVKKKITFDDVVINLYEAPLKNIFNRNVTAEDYYGNIIWQIKDVSAGIEPSQDMPFSNIEPYNNEKILAMNFNGWQYYVSIKTGEMELVYKERF
jgi:hypothetical protein